ncbi:MAG: hypothetical protein ACJ75F_00435 [Flavisolibacter sp.]|jgi:hypothetical protein
MKRILALFLFVGLVSAASAQSGRNQSRDIVLGGKNPSVYDRSNNGYGTNSRRDNSYYSTRERDVQIERIKREYDWKIQNVYNDRYLRNSAKKRKVRMLEDERNDRIREVMRDFNQNNRTTTYGRRY